MLEIILFVLLGAAAGIGFGLVPGLHPNAIIIFVPIIAASGIEPAPVIVFVAAMAAANSIADTIPSIMLGAPEAGSELSVLPGHRLLMSGYGYDAVKLTVIGSVGAAVVCILLLSLLLP